MVGAIMSTGHAGERNARTGRDWAWALAATLALVALSAAQGFAGLHAHGSDNDSLLRMVQIRDLLAGQGWFDTMQYRMGLDGGFAMHWSRLVDLPIAAIIVAGAWLGGDMAAGETAALIAWPSLLLALSLFFVIRTARFLAGDFAILPATVIGAAALHFTGVFAIGALDHHNFQLALALAATFWLATPDEKGARAGAAGLASAAMLAIGVETLPVVAATCVIVALGFLVEGGARARNGARNFGLAFAAGTALAFAATVAPARWATTYCDQLSTVHLALAALGGVGLAGIAILSAGWDLKRRAGALAALGVCAGLVALIFFRHCLGDPYAGLDPRLRSLWLDHVIEAQTFAALAAAGRFAMVLGYFVTPFLALLVLTYKAARGGLTRAEAVLAAMIGVAFLVSLWQVRGAAVSIPLAAIFLSGWIGTRRRLVWERADTGRQGAMIAAWVLSFNVAWFLGGEQIDAARAGQTAGGAVAEASDETACHLRADYVALTALEPGLVLAISNLGAPILAYSDHRVLAGPYHRNVAGNLRALDLLMAAPGDGAQLEAAGISHVAHCPGDPESRALALWAPDGLTAALGRGDVPAFLEPVAGPAETKLKLYRVRAP